MAVTGPPRASCSDLLVANLIGPAIVDPGLSYVTGLWTVQSGPGPAFWTLAIRCRGHLASELLIGPYQAGLGPFLLLGW